MLISSRIAFYGPVSWGCRIHQLYLCRRVRPHSNEFLGYYFKPSDWGRQSFPSLPLFPGPLWPGVVALDRMVWFYGIPTTVSYLMTNPVCICISNIYMIRKHLVDNILKYVKAFSCAQLNGFKYCQITVTI